ncbi:MAG: DUF3784 domain-containing protein [Firmicutes bacterium]|nr:DUF3784 domain-containing protein [Bacillota bacterium]
MVVVLHIVAVCVSLSLIGLSIPFLMGKGAEFIGGYDETTAHKFNLKKIARFAGFIILFSAVLIHVGILALAYQIWWLLGVASVVLILGIILGTRHMNSPKFRNN